MNHAGGVPIEESQLRSRISSSITKVQESDVLYRTILRRFSSHTRLFVTIALINLTVWATVGAIVEFTHPAESFIGVLSGKELPWGPFLFGFFVPAMWVFYAWLPSAAIRSAGVLCSEGVINCGPNPDHPDLIADLTTNFSRRRFTFIALVITALATAFYFTAIVPADIKFSGGQLTFWYVSVWSMAVLGVLIAEMAYVVSGFVLKALVVSNTLRMKFMEKGVIKLHLYHPDRSAGTGSIGQLAMRPSYAVVLIGVWATWGVFLPTTAGGRPNLLVAAIIYPIFLLLSFAVMLSVIYPAHRAMKRFKYSQLEGKTIEWVREEDMTSDGARNKDQELLRLREYYELTSSLPEWPISLPQLGRFTLIIFAFVPAITGLASLGLDIFRTLLGS